ncbi:uncharacterized protein LOC107968076 isoform X2 [Pan troglodytes]|uniref:uncharacterized protein LOC107968076 isoform X2 n=1 Tax=Pan troglodytes TaxID=9598 RepID=UPI003013D28F
MKNIEQAPFQGTQNRLFQHRLCLHSPCRSMFVTVLISIGMWRNINVLLHYCQGKGEKWAEDSCPLPLFLYQQMESHSVIQA